MDDPDATIQPAKRRPIPPNPPRWEPSVDPASVEIPGLDTTASAHEQIEQIEQLITIKLQDIDENFAKIHHVLTSRILPAVKRYSVGTEPVREAAKFWTSFYEKAAQIKIPTFDDYSTVNEQSSHRTEEETESEDQQGDASAAEPTYEPSVAGTENSFMPAKMAYSSTPATERHGLVRSFTTPGNNESWSASLESPLVRLDREIQSLSLDEDPQLSTATTAPDTTFQPRDKGKGRETSSSQPMLRNVLRQNLYGAGSNASSPQKSFTYQTSPLRPRGKLKTPIPKDANPYLPPNEEPSQWTGVVDLRNTPNLSTPYRSSRHNSTYSKSRVQPSKPAEDENSEADESWEGGLPPGMSPPVLMSPARPPRSSAELGLLRLGQTPSKEAAARITRDLLDDTGRSRLASGGAKRLFGGPSSSFVESSMSTVPTPPSLSRYRRSFESDSLDSTMRPGSFHLSSSQDTGSDYATPFAGGQQVQYDDDDDSFENEVNTTAHPSAAFLMASAAAARRGSGSSDDSMDSLDDDMDDPDIAPVHPFDRMSSEDIDDDDDFDDSYDTGPPGPAFHLQGLNVFDDTTGMSAALRPQVDDSPTPATWKRG